MLSGALRGREIILGVTGSIAAYKACELASRLVEAGAVVRPVLTRNALQFVGAATFEGITGNHAITDMFAGETNPEIAHIALSRRAALFVVAPATANVIAKAAQGLADDWLTTTLLATRAPVLFAPAMNTHMYAHPATQANLALLGERGCHFVGPGAGQLACRDVGPGRMAEVPEILAAMVDILRPTGPLLGKRVLITSGATHEPIDPVRYIGNRSTGKMGAALAGEALRRGAEVTVVLGPGALLPPAGVEVVRVETAQQMLDAVATRLTETDVFIAAAAVADYRLDVPASSKHKRNGKPLTLALIPNPDIAHYVGEHKHPGLISIGFAAETDDVLVNAAEKLRRKNFDLLLANPVGGADTAIGADATQAWLLAPDEPPADLGRLPKADISRILFDRAEVLSAARLAQPV